jgi:hypothetical protein
VIYLWYNIKIWACATFYIMFQKIELMAKIFKYLSTVLTNYIRWHLICGISYWYKSFYIIFLANDMILYQIKNDMSNVWTNLSKLSIKIGVCVWILFKNFPGYQKQEIGILSLPNAMPPWLGWWQRQSTLDCRYLTYYVTNWKRECSSKTFFPDTILGICYFFPVIPSFHYSTAKQFHFQKKISWPIF